MPMKTATLDTSVLMEFWCNQDKAEITKSLLNLAKDGQIDLAITSRIKADVPNMPLANRINELPTLNVRQIGSVFRFDCSKWDEGDLWGSDVFTKVMTSIEDWLDRQGRSKSRPDWKDWDHLYGHFLSRRQVFLTWDCGIFAVASELHEQLGVVVSAPEDFLSSHN